MNKGIVFILLIIGVILVSGCASQPQINDTVPPSDVIPQNKSNEISTIVEKIKSPLSEDGVAALEKLAHIGTEEAVQALIDKVETLDEFKGNADESGLISLFAQIENPEATVVLVNKLKSGEDEFLVPGIVYTLGNIGNEEAVTALVELAQEAYEQQADYATIQQEFYLAISRSKHLPSLLSAAKNVKLFWEIRAKALDAISNVAINTIGDAATTDVLTDILPDLEKIRDDTSLYVEIKRAADRAVNNIKARDTYEQL